MVLKDVKSKKISELDALRGIPDRAAPYTVYPREITVS